MSGENISIKFNRPGMEDWLFEPFGIHSNGQEEPQAGDIIVEINDQRVIIPHKLVQFHNAWIKQPQWLKDCSKFYYDYIFLDEEDKKEIDTILEMIKRNINTKRVAFARRKY